MLNLNYFVDAISTWEKEFEAESKHGAFKKPIDEVTGSVISDFGSSADLSAVYSELCQREDDMRQRTGYRLPLGLVCVVGPGFAGKSTYVRKMIAEATDSDAFQMLSMGEVGSVLPFDVMRSVVEAAATDKILVIDSWKDIWNDWHFANTALQTGGIYTSLTAFLGQLSQALFLAGRTVLAVFNPQTSGERETVYQMLNTQCAGMIRLSGTSVGHVDFAQGRSIVRGYNGPFSVKTGLPVQREFIFDEHGQQQNTGFGSFFTKPII
jgi:hypothetical protein